MVSDFGPLYEACRAKKLLTINYTDKKGITTDRTGGVYEIHSEEGKLWFWDTTANDNIRVYFLSSINSFEVLATYFTDNQWPIKIDGQVVG
jgi:predicted DNA-binding transcriptional regulator YafY